MLLSIDHRVDGRVSGKFKHISVSEHRRSANLEYAICELTWVLGRKRMKLIFEPVALIFERASSHTIR
jgi:hypothetical protein